MTVELATASYRSWVPGMGTPVRISLGRPRYPINYELTEQVAALKPFGLLGIADDQEFTERYRANLDRIGVQKLSAIFSGIANRYGGHRLCFLCFEDVLSVGKQKPCHRRDFAAWWTEQTGQPVPELSWVCGPDGVPVVVRELHHRW